MRRYAWPRASHDATALVPADHAAFELIAGHILDHAVAGRSAFEAGSFAEAKYHRDCCGLGLWRLGVDGLTPDGQIRWDGAKYETRLPGRLSSEEARRVRESVELRGKKASALRNRLACDHIVPRNCVAEALLRPGGWVTTDREGGLQFLRAHAEVAILSLDEERRLGLNWKEKMPAVWWDAPFQEKVMYAHSRYDAVAPRITVTRWPG